MIKIPAVILSQLSFKKKEYFHCQLYDHQLYIVQDVLRDLGYKPFEEFVSWIENVSPNQYILGGNMVYLEKQENHVDWGYIRLDPQSEDFTEISYENTIKIFFEWNVIKPLNLRNIAITRENDIIRILDFELLKQEQCLKPRVDVLGELIASVSSDDDDDE